MGHVLGLPDVSPTPPRFPNDLMDLTLATGVRRIPLASDLQALQTIASMTQPPSDGADPGTVTAIANSSGTVNSNSASTTTPTGSFGGSFNPTPGSSQYVWTVAPWTTTPIAAFGEPQLLTPASAPLGPLVDGQFNQGADDLAGWSTSDPHYVTVNSASQAVIAESPTDMEVDLYQDFMLPQGAKSLSFTLDSFTFGTTRSRPVPPPTPSVSPCSTLQTLNPLVSTATVDSHTDSYFIEDVVPGATAEATSGVTVHCGWGPRFLAPHHTSTSRPSTARACCCSSASSAVRTLRSSRVR